jgi:hypothetical protein
VNKIVNKKLIFGIIFAALALLIGTTLSQTIIIQTYAAPVENVQYEIALTIEEGFDGPDDVTFQILSFSWGEELEDTTTIAKPLTIVKRYDEHSANLFLSSANQRTFGTIFLSVKVGGGPEALEILLWEMNYAKLIGYDIQIDETQMGPYELLTFTFRDLEYNTAWIDSRGQILGSDTEYWDFLGPSGP